MKTYTIVVTESLVSGEEGPTIQRFMFSADREDINPILDAIHAALRAKARAPRSDKGHRRAAAE